MAFDLVARLRLVDNMTSPLKRAIRNIQQAQNTVNKTSKSFASLGTIGQKSLVQVQNAGAETVKQLGLVAGAAGAVATAFSSINKAMDFEAQLSSIQALTGATNEEMEKMRDLALEMGAKTRYSALEAAKGIEELLKAGLTPAAVQAGGLEAALNLATAGELELAEAAEIMSTAMNAYRRDTLKAAEASNILAGTANASATSVQELRYSLAQVSAVASGVGLSFADTNVALGLFANNGLKGSDAGTSLKTMLSNLQPSTKKQIALFKELGLMTANGVNRFYDAEGRLRSLKEIAGLLRNALKDLTDQQRQEALITMFGSDAVRAATILYKEGAEGVENFYREMTKVTALDVARKKMDNAAGAIEEFRGALETLQISILIPTLPLIKQAASYFADFVEGLNTRKVEQWGESIKNSIINAYQAGKDIYNLISANWSTIKNVVLGIAGAFVIMRTAMMTAMVISTLTKLMNAYRAGTLAATIAQRSLNAALLMNPMTWVIAGILALIAAIVLLVRNWETVREKASEIWGSISSKVSELLTSLGEWIQAKFDQIRNWITEKLQQARDAVVWIFTEFPFIAAEQLGYMLGVAVSWLSQLPERFYEWLTNTKDRAVISLTEIANSFREWFSKAVNNAIEFVSSLPDQIIGYISSIPGRVASVISSVWASFRELGASIPRAISEGFRSALGALDRAGRWVVDKIIGGASALSEMGARFVRGYEAGRVAGSHYHGLDYVPYDGYVARLHRGEAVLPREEAEAYRGGQGKALTIQIPKLADQIVVRDERDIDAITRALVREIRAAWEAGA